MMSSSRLVIIAACVAFVYGETSHSHFYAHLTQPHVLLNAARSQAEAFHQLASDSSHTELDDTTDLLNQVVSPRELLQYAQAGHGDYNISDKCANQTLYLLESFTGFISNQSWSKNMIDAWGKPSAGINTGHIRWLGNYDECVGISADLSAQEPGPNTKFQGRYCSAGISLVNPGLVTLPISFSAGLCVPSGCDETDVLAMVQSLTDLVNANISHELSVLCQQLQSEVTLTPAAVACLVVYGLFALVCILATLYDYMFVRVSPTSVAGKPTASGTASINGHLRENGDDTELLVPPPIEKAVYTPGTAGQILMCFSMYTNGYKMLSAKQAPGSIDCLHGIRFISLTWVILGHSLVFSFTIIGNFMGLVGWVKEFGFQAILNATVSVDSFFVLSALLCTYLFIKEFERTKKTTLGFLMSVPVMYLHRYIRLTPAYGFMIFFYTHVSIFMMEGPLRPVANVTDPSCVNNSWSNLLYLSNLYDPAHQCTAWGWYLSNDFQFFIVAPFLAYLLYRLPVAGILLNTVMIITSCGAATGISVMYDLGVTMFGPRDPTHPAPDELAHEMDDYYFKPWARYQSYGVGIFAGYILYRLKKNNTRIPPMANVGLWMISATLCMLVIYGPYDISRGGHIATVAEAAIYNGWARTAWSIGLSYVIIACATGNGGWVNEFLSWPGFIPLSRLTFCAYLIHPVIMVILTYNNRDVIDWTYWTLMTLFVAYMTLAYAAAFLFSLMFESPFMLIDKKFITGKLK